LEFGELWGSLGSSVPGSFGDLWGALGSFGELGELWVALGSSGKHFWEVLKRGLFCKAGTEPCHKKCAQGTFWKKCGAVPTPGGTYLIFARS